MTSLPQQRAEKRLGQRDRQPAGKQIERQTDDHFVGAERHHEQREGGGHGHGGGNPDQQATQRRPGPDRPQDAEEGADEHLTLETDIENAGLGRERPAERDQQDRRRRAQRRGDERDIEDTL